MAWICYKLLQSATNLAVFGNLLQIATLVLHIYALFKVLIFNKLSVATKCYKLLHRFFMCETFFFLAYVLSASCCEDLSVGLFRCLILFRFLDVNTIVNTIV